MRTVSMGDVNIPGIFLFPPELDKNRTKEFVLQKQKTICHSTRNKNKKTVICF